MAQFNGNFKKCFQEIRIFSRFLLYVLVYMCIYGPYAYVSFFVCIVSFLKGVSLTLLNTKEKILTLPQLLFCSYTGTAKQ